MVAHIIGGEGWASRAVALRDGPAWVLTRAGGIAFASIDAASERITVEAPVVRLPHRQRVPALRAALELGARDDLGCRMSLRGDKLLARFEGLLDATPPEQLAAAIARVAELSDAEAASFAARFDAEPILTGEDRASAGFEVLGTARVLSPLVPEGASPRVVAAPAAEPEPDDDIPAILAPAFASPTSSRAQTTGRTTPAPIRRDTSPYFQAASGPVSRRSTVHGLDVEPPSRRAGSVPPPPAEPPSDADRLCDLLRQTQALATRLSFEEKPATMLLLVRAAVYRAIHAHGESLPDAVAHLHRATSATTKELWATGARRPSTQMPVAEPALLVMERIASLRAQVPREAPLAVEPLTTASDAKEHLARYFAEIEHAPSEPVLRHFLALGALCELLVRTKLPATTTERLRDIVAHAERGGPKASTIDLMMTALARIVAR
jgi:hypothetical protein